MTCIHGYLLCFLFHRRWFIQSSDCRYLSSVLGFQPPREGEEEGQGEGGGRGCSRDIRWDKSYYRGQVAWPVRGNLRRCQNGWPAYEHGNHIRLKPHCLMDAICLNPIIRPQFITAYPFLLSILFALTTLLPCYYLLSRPSRPTCNRKCRLEEGGRGIFYIHAHPCNDREIFSHVKILILPFILRKLNKRNIFIKNRTWRNLNARVILVDLCDGWEIFSL